ncbi:MAG: VOC family protein [Acidimicrobiales bacterium]|nr:VOC family protein [Acidimicrobiales bacterium]
MVDDSKAFSSYSIDDIPVATAFYRGTLGLDVTEQPEGLGLNLATGASVFLYPKDNHEPATFTVLNFPVDDLSAAIDELTGKGVTMERYEGFDQDKRGIASGPSGPHIAWFKDPAGNVLSVTQL